MSDEITPEVLIPLIDSGLGRREIARHLGRTPDSVKYWLKKYGLRTNGLWDNRETGTSASLWKQLESAEQERDLYKEALCLALATEGEKEVADIIRAALGAA